MASIFRVGVPKLGSCGLSTRLCKTPKNPCILQVAFMTRKAHLDDDIIRPKPFPYWKKRYTLYHQLMDPMMYRFNENTKLLVVEGPFAAGKSKLAEKIADEFGMLYMPAPTHDEYYINQYGFDIRSLDPKLPPGAQSFDLPKFLENPNDLKAAEFQDLFYLMRFEQYLNALLHLLSTGQGVVLNRCVLSDIVFMQAMVNAGYVNGKVMKYYKDARDKMKAEILKPHAVIYLDTPVNVVKDNIQKRGISYEINSKVFTKEYLSDIERLYKDVYLREMSNHSHLLIYDWSKNSNPQIIVEDIEHLDFDSHTKRPGKLSDWVFDTVHHVREKRIMCDDKTDMYITCLKPNDFNSPPELWYTPDECGAIDEALQQEHTEKYAPGYNDEAGDNVLFKREPMHTTYIRRSPRDFVNREKYMAT